MKTLTLALLCLSAPAFADDVPDAPAPAETKPDPAPEPKPEPAKLEPVPTPRPTGGEAFAMGVEDHGAPIETTNRRDNPRFALELSALAATNANPYLQHEGWNFETGPARGVRVEAQWIGISLGAETSTMSNKRVCGVGCFEGDFGNTTITAVDLGFRFRFRVGPVRPFLSGAFGGVRASSGGWTMTSDKTVYGGHARATAGVELPLPGRLFASGQIGYRFAVTQNPLRDPDKETLDTALLGTDTSTGTFAEDSHQVVMSVGVGVEL